MDTPDANPPPARLPHPSTVQALQARLVRVQAELAALQAELATLLPAPASPPDEPPTDDAPPANASTAATGGIKGTVAVGTSLLLLTPNDSDDDSIAPNGIRADTGEPLLRLGRQAAAHIAGAIHHPTEQAAIHRARAARNEHLGPLAGINEDSLPDSGWALVVPATDNARLLRALEPLLRHRCDQQGIALPPLTYHDGETCSAWVTRYGGTPTNWRHLPVLLYTPDTGSSAWLQQHGTSHGPVDPQRGVPFYLLLVGRPGPRHAHDAAHIPFAFQYELDMFWGVGRLCFTNEQGEHRYAEYTAYAEQVVAFEQAAQAPYERQITYFATRHDMDNSTQKSADELIVPLSRGRPGAQNVPPVAVRAGFAQQVFLQNDATRDTLNRIVRGKATGGRPAILFTATHGIGLPHDDPRLPAEQGALLCQEWTGIGTIKRDHWYAASDLPDDTAVQGMFVVCFGCYSAGCPATDQFTLPTFGADGSLSRAARVPPPIAPYPLIARLPQMLLAKGALAVLGHIDRGWTYSFRGDVGVPAQSQIFEDVLYRVMQGKRVGYALDQMNRQQGAFAALLTQQIEHIAFGKQVSDSRMRALWVAHTDARNYALLGDPAVRLPFGAHSPADSPTPHQ